MIRQLQSRHVGHSAARGWVVLLCALTVVMLACGFGGGSTVLSSNSSGATATATSDGSGGTTPTSTTTTTNPTATPTQGTGPTATPIPFSVSSATVSASPANFNGQCTSTMTTNFTATINVPAHTSGGTVTYHWVRSDGGTGSTQTLHFNAGDTWHTVSTSWSFGAAYGNGSTYWEEVVVTAPNSVTSSHGNAALTCQLHVTSAFGSVTPGSYSCGSSSVTFTFNGAFDVTPGPGGTITYKWIRSDGATVSSKTVSVPAGNTDVLVSTSWTLYSGVPNGTYWEELQASSPNSVTSSKMSFTVSC